MARRQTLSESPTLRKYRELLGVSESATADELKKAYHQRAFLYHPDRNSDPQAPAQFQQVREAFTFLSDSSQVRSLKQNHLKERLFNACIDGLQISFGALFGHRVYVSGDTAIPAKADVYIEEDKSILDDPAYDSIEVVYAGRFSKDEENLLTATRPSTHRHLPWVVLNNKGIIDFMNGNFDRSLKCYQELNERIPNNIIFLYREALCHIILAFKNRETSLFGRSRPAQAPLKKGVQLLKRCILIGESRPVGKQKCVVIRKFLADVLEQSGHRRSSKKIWKDIARLQLKSVEAAIKAGNRQKAQTLLTSKGSSRTSAKSINKALLSGRSR